jgi:predicted nucleic acid-binding protein
MNDVRAFVDTNVFVYLYSDVDDFKQKCAFFALNQYNCQISTQVINEFSHVCALDVHERYGYAYYDSLIIASALEGNCRYLLSEDMADGQVIEGRLTIKNIFAHENS